MTESLPPEHEPKGMPRWLRGLLITLAVLVVVFGVCTAMVFSSIEGAVLLALGL